MDEMRVSCELVTQTRLYFFNGTFGPMYRGLAQGPHGPMPKQRFSVWGKIVCIVKSQNLALTLSPHSGGRGRIHASVETVVFQPLKNKERRLGVLIYIMDA